MEVEQALIAHWQAPVAVLQTRLPVQSKSVWHPVVETGQEVPNLSNSSNSMAAPPHSLAQLSPPNPRPRVARRAKKIKNRGEYITDLPSPKR